MRELTMEELNAVENQVAGGDLEVGSIVGSWPSSYTYSGSTTPGWFAVSPSSAYAALGQSGSDGSDDGGSGEEDTSDNQQNNGDPIVDSEKFEKGVKDFVSAAETALKTAKEEGTKFVIIAGEKVGIDDAIKALGQATKVLDGLSLVKDVTLGDYRSAAETLTDSVVSSLVAAGAYTGAMAFGISGAPLVPIAAIAGITAAAVISVPYIVEETFEFITEDIPAGFQYLGEQDAAWHSYLSERYASGIRR